MKKPLQNDVESFDLLPGRTLARKYEVVARLGSGWEGEVYRIREKSTGIERAAKLFFPHRNVGNKAAKDYATKLHKLRECPIVIHYHTEETVVIRRTPITVLVSEYVEGEQLGAFLERQAGRRLHPFQALHLLHAIVTGLTDIHSKGEYHGDLHSENVIVTRCGLHFDLKILDFMKWEARKREAMQDDICDALRIFYDALGGSRYYSRQSPQIRKIVCGNKRSLILKRFPTALQLRTFLETLEWE